MLFSICRLCPYGKGSPKMGHYILIQTITEINEVLGQVVAIFCSSNQYLFSQKIKPDI